MSTPLFTNDLRVKWFKRAVMRGKRKMKKQKCSKCGEIKSIADFTFRTDKGTHRKTCHTCTNARQRRWYNVPENSQRVRKKTNRYKKNNKEKHNKLNRKYRAVGKPWYKEYLLRKRLKRYGLTKEQYVELLVLQNFRCKICLKKADNLRIDHDHESGKVRGLLCNACNLALGLFRDNTQVLNDAKKYISESLRGHKSTKKP